MNKLYELFDEYPMLDLGDFILRKIDLSDQEDLHDIYSDERVMKYQGEPVKSNIEQINEFIEFIDSGFKRKYFIRWGVVDKSYNKVIGLISFHHIDFNNNNGQIGYILNRLYWNKGIMSFVVSEIIRYLFRDLKLHKLELSIHPENIASIRIAEKIGFKEEGLRKDCVYNFAKAEYESRVIMGLIND